MKKYLIILIFIQILIYVRSPIPNWDLSKQANILDVTNPEYYTIYEKKAYDIKVILKKKMYKSGNKVLTENIVYVYGKENDNDLDYNKYIDEKIVDFDAIDSHYTNKLGCDILICPKGKFQPYNFKGEKHIDAPSGFEDKGGWDLRCYAHNTGYFYLFYLNNNGKNIFYKYNGDFVEKKDYIYSYFYDFKYENGYDGGVEYKFCILRYDGANGGVIRLCPKALNANKDNGDVNLVDNGSDKDINQAKAKTQACFNSNHKFFYFTYNNVYDFESGYSTNYIDFSKKSLYESSVNNINNYIEKKTTSPFTFADNVEIEEMNFISGSKYAYYKIYNKDKNVTYYGLIDVTENKILYNVQAEFKTFIPASTSDTAIMLGITETTVYQLCIIKSCCQNECSSGNLILDEEGNKCQESCDSGKVKLMPEDYCIKKESCDLDVYELNSGETICGFCKYINEGGSALYKFVNTRGCISISSFPSNAEYYNEEAKLLKCIEHYHLNNGECVPDSCYERCETCFGYSIDINEQKCSSCKEGYDYDKENGNCNDSPTPQTTVIIPPTAVIIPPTTIIIPPTTSQTSPTTIVTPSTTVVTLPTTITAPPTTIITPPTTIIIPPTTNIIPPTTVISPPPTTQIVKEEYVENCRNKNCLTCNVESDRLGLCLSCDLTKYKKVNYTNTYYRFINCVKEKDLEEKYYYDISSEQYKPCYKLCNKCIGPGNTSYHNCLECEENYMFRPGDNPNNNCVVYSKYYYLSAYNEYKPLASPQCPEEAKYTIINDENKTSCIYDCKTDKIYKYLYNGNCLKKCPSGTRSDNYKCKETDPSKIYISEKPVYLTHNKSLEEVGVLASTYAQEFSDTKNHISVFKNDDYNILIYKNPNILGRTNLTATDIDFGECYEEVKKAYNITENLIIAVGDQKINNHPSTFYLFYHPISGQRLETGDLCQNKNISMKENILNMLDEKSEKYELQTALTKQGINIFDIEAPYYKDICYDFDNPKKRDIALKDRIKETYENVSLCDDGCINTGIDVKNNVATCNCKFNEITNSEIINDNPTLGYLVGEFFELVNSSNILVLKCYKNLIKYFTRSIGGMIILSLIALCLIFSCVFFFFEKSKMRKYIYSLMEKYVSFLINYSNVFKLFPPKRKSLNNKKPNDEIVINKKGKSLREDLNKNAHKINIKQNTSRTLNPIINSKDFILTSKKRKTQLLPIKEKIKEEGINPYLEEGKKIKKFFKEYLCTSPDDMEFDDAIKKDKRGFCEYFCDCLKEKQSFCYTFISSDPINTRMIKFILFSLNITLYFVVNGLFFTESYISDLYNTDEDSETFFSFVGRSIFNVLKTTLVSILIGYLTDFFFIYENKIKGIFKRDKENTVILKRNIVLIIQEIEKRYLSFIIMTFFILLISLYYILCFNYVYPKTQIEWIKSSILIIVIMQLLSVLKCLFEAIFRTLSFKCESEKIFKVGKIFDNNS